MALIKLNAEEIVSYGGDIKNMATQVETLLGEISTLVTQINSGWEGLGNQAFVAQYTDLSSKLQKLPEVVTGVGQKAIAAGETWLETENALGKQA